MFFTILYVFYKSIAQGKYSGVKLHTQKFDFAILKVCQWNKVMFSSLKEGLFFDVDFLPTCPSGSQNCLLSSLQQLENQERAVTDLQWNTCLCVSSSSGNFSEKPPADLKKKVLAEFWG